MTRLTSSRMVAQWELPVYTDCSSVRFKFPMLPVVEGIVGGGSERTKSLLKEGISSEFWLRFTVLSLNSVTRFSR